MNQKNILLVIGGLLLLIGLLKPDFTKLINKPTDQNNPVVVDHTNDKVKKPEDPELLKLCDNITLSLNNTKLSATEKKQICKKLSSLYYDISKLISLDGKNTIIKNTDEVRGCNSLSGLMLIKLNDFNIADNFENLGSSCEKVLEYCLSGNDNINLTPELRNKSVEAFMALSWAFNEGSR